MKETKRLGPYSLYSTDSQKIIKYYISLHYFTIKAEITKKRLSTKTFGDWKHVTDDHYLVLQQIFSKPVSDHYLILLQLFSKYVLMIITSSYYCYLVNISLMIITSSYYCYL